MENEAVEQYFPELEKSSYLEESKWGILNVYLTKCKRVMTKHQWKYNYFDEESKKIKVISSYDLVKLRTKVLNQGLDWIITNKEYADESYKLNEKLLQEHDAVKKNKKSRNSSSGVKYVYRRPDKGSRQGFYWTYVNKTGKGKQKSYSSITLPELEEKVKSEGLPWIIVNEEVYKDNDKIKKFFSQRRQHTQ